MPRSSQTVALVTALVASVALSSAFADVVVKKPGAASPKTDLGDAELQKTYDGMWEGYGEATANTSDTLSMALSGFQKKAQEDGNLDLALVWGDMLKSFTENGQAKWDNGAEAKKDWKAQFSETPFPSTPFPDEIANTLEQCNKNYRAAKEDLVQSYDELVKAITMKGNLDQAKALRGEKANLIAGQGVRPELGKGQQKPPSWTEGIRDALCGTQWLHKNQFRYTFRRDGTYVLEGTPRGGKYVIVDDEKVVLLRWNHDPGLQVINDAEVINVAEAPEKWWMTGGPFRVVHNDPHPVKGQRQLFLADLPVKQSLVGWDRLQLGKVPERAVNGKVGDKVIVACAASRVVFDLPQGFEGFINGSVGIADVVLESPCSCMFKIYGDDREVWRSEPIGENKGTGQSLIQAFSVPLIGFKQVTLEVDPLGNNHSDWSVWIDPVLTWKQRAK